MTYTKTGSKHTDHNKKDLTILKAGESIPNGTWLPVSISALYFNVTRQTIWNLFYSGQIRGLKFIAGPILVCLEDIKSAAVN